MIATASLIGGIFGRGGGSELRSAELEQAFVKRFGKRAGRRAWSDFRSKNDPEAPTTVVGKRFPYEQTPKQARATRFADSLLYSGLMRRPPVGNPPGRSRL